MKRLLLISSILLAACASEAVVETPADPVTDTFLTQIQTDFPATLSPIANGVWVHTTNYRLPGQAPIPTNGLVVVDEGEVTLIDGAWGELATLALIEQVEAETGFPVKRMIVTSHQPDRTQGVDAAEYRGIQIYTHPTTPILAAQSGLPAPNTSVASLERRGARTRVGRIELAFPGHGHSPDNLIAYLPDEAILYGGNLVKGAGAVSLGAPATADPESWRDALNWIKTTYPETQTVVPGRGKGANLSLVDATLALIDPKPEDD